MHILVDTYSNWREEGTVLSIS